MKKIITIIMLLSLVFSLAQPCYALSEGSDATVFENDIMFIIVCAVVTAWVVLMVLLPVLNKIRKAADKFSTATEIVESAKAESDKAIKDNGQEFSEAKREVIECCDAVKNEVSKLERMTSLGFGNTKELVVSGVARKIERIRNEEED